MLGFPGATSQTINEQNTPPKPPRPPTIEKVQYGPFEQNDLDLYIAKSDKPTPLVLHFFGGAWVVGNKNAISPFLLDACAEAGITVASINYRYSTQAIYPGPFLDGARALQFLRLHAKEYNLNPAAVASTGGSAGADISLWLGFHDDLADPASDDPVKRQSTRISCVGAGSAQTVFDPRVVDTLLNKPGTLKSAIPKLFGLSFDELESRAPSSCTRTPRRFRSSPGTTHPCFSSIRWPTNHSRRKRRSETVSITRPSASI